MLSKPYCGWCDVVIGDFKAPASYLSEVPVDCLNAMILAISNSSDFCVSFDAEGWEYKVISDRCKTFVIIEKDGVELKVIDKDIISLKDELIDDIESNIKDWSHWSLSEEDDSVEEVQLYEKDLMKKIEILKNLSS